MIIWIASYPKSGNTWIRSFLSHYLYSDKHEFNFDLLKKIKAFPEDKELNFLRKKYNNKFEFLDVVNHWDFFQTEIAKKSPVFLKTHNALVTINNCSFATKKNTLGLIYVIRDPRDVVVSYSHHMAKKFEDTFQLMKIDSMEKTKDKLNKTYLTNWPNHYASWKAFPIDKLFLKYEDLVKDPEKEFIKIIRYLNKICKIKFNRERIIKSTRATNFENLQKLEDKNSFHENPKETKDQKFFRKGTSNQWQKLLSKDLINKIQNEFSQTMKKNGYEF